MGNAIVRGVRWHCVHEPMHAAFGTTGRRGRGCTVSTDSGGPTDAFPERIIAHGNRGRGDVHSTTKPRGIAT